MQFAAKLICLLVLLHGKIYGNDSLPAKIISGLEYWEKSHPLEKVYLHTDKSSYIAGENIWYKSYISLDAKPSFLSKIIYVELVDEKGKVIEKQMRPIIDGVSSGDIVLNKNLLTGNYSINAYSLWMLNFRPFVYTKPIRIYNHDYQPSIIKHSEDFIVHFFPEGGNLVNGLKSSIGFYATNLKGLPIDVNGFISDATGNKITLLNTAHKGYGKFEIIPTNESLIAEINFNGLVKKFQLPQVQLEGINLTVNNLNENRTFIQLSRQVKNQTTYNDLVVVAQMYGKPVFIGQVNFNEDATGMSIVKKYLPPGIMQITVLDLTGKPLAERLVFVNNQNVRNIEFSTDSISVQSRGKNKYTLNLSQYVAPSVSVAIIDSDLSGKVGIENNIVSNFLLTSDLKGYIHEPGYYFYDKSPERTGHLDLLMLTHGWRRFIWDDVLNKKEISLKYPVETGISVSGKVTVPGSPRAITNGYVDILTKGEDSTTILSKAMLTSTGEFLVNDLDFQHKATMYLQGTRSSNEKANVEIHINKNYIDTLKYSEFKPSQDLDTSENLLNNKTILSTLIQDLASNNKMITLSEVTVSAKKISRIDSLNREYASDLFQLGQSLELTTSNYISIWQFLRQQVNGLVVEGDLVNPNVYFTRFAGLRIPGLSANEEGNNQLGEIETNGITYFLNEVNVSKDVISTLHPEDVALVKVFKGPEGAALGVNEGGIAVYTKKGSNNRRRPAEKGFFTDEKFGFSTKREFFNPDYSVSIDSTFIDSRTTLYWNPNLKTDKSGKATLRFFNNDISKKFKISIQGMDKKGELIFKELILQ